MNETGCVQLLLFYELRQGRIVRDGDIRDILADFVTEGRIVYQVSRYGGLQVIFRYIALLHTVQGIIDDIGYRAVGEGIEKQHFVTPGE